jgi:CDP-diacylglycerol---glycerol-3-phosphate 3-phosphatidyltransferase
MANLITLIRLLSVFVITALLLYAPPVWQLLNVPLVIIVMLLDGLDGIIARARSETSVFGAVFDIAADRIIEISLWITLTYVTLVSIWVPLIFLVRGVLVDALRKPHSNAGKTPFSIMRTKLGDFLVASRFMRFLYGAMKLITFAWLLFMLPFSSLWPDLWLENYTLVQVISYFLTYFTVFLCLARGLPVIVEAFLMEPPMLKLKNRSKVAVKKK